jgi:hypothetical protein
MKLSLSLSLLPACARKKESVYPSLQTSSRHLLRCNGVTRAASPNFSPLSPHFTIVRLTTLCTVKHVWNPTHPESIPSLPAPASPLPQAENEPTHTYLPLLPVKAHPSPCPNLRERACPFLTHPASQKPPVRENPLAPANPPYHSHRHFRP